MLFRSVTDLQTLCPELILSFYPKSLCPSLQSERELWKVIEVNNELKFNVDEQQDDINHLKEQCDKDTYSKVQKITAVITPTKRKACVCDMWSSISIKIMKENLF